MRRIGILLVTMAVGVAPVAGAATDRSGSASGVWLAGYGSWNSYSMRDVNRVDVAMFNDEFAEWGLSMEEIKSGSGVGLEAGIDLSRVSLGLGYERLGAATVTAWKLDNLPQYGYPVSFEYKVPADAFRLRADYRLPTARPLGVRLGVAGGIAVLKGALSGAAVGRSVSLEYSGMGMLLEVFGSGEWWASPRLALGSSLGYRYARADEPKIAGVKQKDFSVDYSGAFVRAGFKFVVTK